MKTQLFTSTIDWKSLLNSVNDPIFVLDNQFNIIWCNAKSLETYGYSESEFLNLHINEIRAPYTQTEIEKYLTGSVYKNEMIFETRHTKKSGELFPVQISTKALTVGNETFYIHSVRDISKRVQAEEELKISEKKYKDLVETAPIGIYVQIESKIVFANRIAKMMFGAENDEDVIGKTIFEFLHPDHYKIFAYRINLLRGGMTSPIVDVKTLGLDGKSLVVEITAKPVIYMNNPAVEVYMNDITIRKKAEERVNLLASIVDSCEDAIISKNMDGMITYWNKGAENLYGYKSNEVLGKSIAILQMHAAKSEVPGIMEILRKGGQINHYHTFRIRKDGGLVKVSVKISPIYENNEITGASEIAFKLDTA